MALANIDAKQLRQGVQKIDDLRNEQKKKGLAEVSKNTDDGESHAHEVAESVTDKHGRGKPIVVQ